MGWMSTSGIPPGTTMLALCGWFQALAIKAYERTSTARSDRDPGQQDALTAIILSVVTLESLVGELEEYVRVIAPSFGQAAAKRGKLLADALDLIEEEKGQL